MYEGITFEDFLKVGAGGGRWGAPGDHKDLVELWLLADPKCLTRAVL